MEKKEMDFLQKLEFNRPINNVENIDNCVLFHWYLPDEIHCIQPGAENILVENILETEESYDIQSFNAMCSFLHVLRSKFWIHSFNEQATAAIVHQSIKQGKEFIEVG